MVCYHALMIRELQTSVQVPIEMHPYTLGIIKKYKRLHDHLEKVGGIEYAKAIEVMNSESNIKIVGKGGYRGGGRPKGLPKGENLFIGQTGISGPRSILPDIVGMLNEYKALYKLYFEATGKRFKV